MTAVVLAGGLGTRMAHLTAGRPKCLLDVGGRPFIQWMLEGLRRGGITHVMMCADSHAFYHILDVVGDGARLGLYVAYSTEPFALGTGGAVANALPHLPADVETFLVLNADTTFECDYRRVKRAPTMIVHRKPHGNTWCAGGHVTDYRKGATGGKYSDCGGYYAAEAFKGHSISFDMEIIIEKAIEANTLEAFEVGEVYEIGSPEGLERARRHLGRP